jgi:FixJ family two-component response regulator
VKHVRDTVYLIAVTPVEYRQITDALSGEPVAVAAYDNAELFLEQVTEAVSGCVLVPYDLPGMGIRAFINQIYDRNLALAVVVIGRKSDVAMAVEVVRAGATDFLDEPFSNRQVRSVVRRAIGVG